MKITTYGHSILISIMGIMICSVNNLLWAMVGGFMIGTGLYLARKSGYEDN